MKEKIIQIVRNIASASGDSLADVADIYEENYFKKEIDELSTLIQEERKEAVEWFVNGYINQLRISPRKENVAPLLRFKKEYLSSIGKDGE